MRPLDPVDVRCPGRTCNAAPGDPCYTSTGLERREPHSLRMLATFGGPLFRCPNGPCPECWHSGWIPHGQLVGLADIGRMVGVSRQAVQQWAKRQDFPPRVGGTAYRVRSEVEAWLAQRAERDSVG